MTRRTFFYTFCLTLMILASSLFVAKNAAAQGVMRIAAVVNDDVISAHDLGQRILLTMTLGRMQDSPQLRNRLARSILRTMIDEKLMLQEIERLEITISEEELQRSIDNFARIQRIRPDRFSALLDSINVDPLVVEEQARAQIGFSKVVRRTGGTRVDVSDREVDAILEQIQLNKGKPEYLYSEIYLPFDAAQGQSAVEQTAQRLIGFINAGSPFAVLARDFSKSSSANNGGDLGWVQSGNVARDIEATLAALPIGSYSNPIRTSTGIYLIHLRDKRISGDEETDEIFKISQIVFPVPANSPPGTMDSRLSQARTVMSQVQSCENLAEIGDSLDNVQSSIVDNVRLSSTPPAIRQPLMTMRPGEITSLAQEASVLVFMVCDRRLPEAKPATLQRRETRNKIYIEKLSLEQERQLKSLRRNAIVDIRL